MNGPHDIGGMQCYGPVMPEADEPVFHAEWEKKALALTVAMGFTGAWNLDMSRHARECLAPDFYLSKSYYQIWLAGLEALMLERGMVTETELETGRRETGPRPIQRLVSADAVGRVLEKGGPVAREPRQAAAFGEGDAVVALNLHPAGHTRLPRYVRGRRGRIEGVHGCHVFPDSNSAGGGEDPQWLYSVRFEARELFGPQAASGDAIMVDCWEPYLARA